MPELLLELLSEEIPARMQARAAEDLKRLVADSLKKDGIKFESLKTFVTPRRLTLVVNGLPVEIEAVEDDRPGPPKAAPEKAVKGYAKSKGVSVDQLEIRDTGKGEYYFAVVKKDARQTIDYMPLIVSEAVFNLGWPKSMQWHSAAMTWVRPIQSILGIFDGKPIGDVFQLGLKDKIPGLKFAMNEGKDAAPGELEIPISNRTKGHRFLSPKPFTVKDFADYKAKLEKAHVILDAAERHDRIEAEAGKLAKAAKLSLKDDPGLLAEVAGLVEWPVVLMGSIDKAFMDLPDEVLTTSMRKHQKYFALLDGKGKLAPKFIVVANTETSDKGKAVIAGNERVLRARLSDAKFFWDQDRKASLESRVDALTGRVFHAKLGTVHDKVVRIETMAGALAKYCGADPEDAKRAARLAKADLSTGMVTEFPDLQGVMGRYYALADGEKSEVAAAIAEHYSPQGPGDACPSAPLSIAVALADKIDTLVGFWAIDEKPTGSKDPFALRRAALGIIRLVLENQLTFSVRELIDAAWDKYLQRHGVNQLHDFQEDLRIFLFDRLKGYLRDKGTPPDLIDALFASGGEDDLLRIVQKADVLKSFLNTDNGVNLLIAYRRANNIVKIESKKDNRTYFESPNENNFQQDEERALLKALNDTAQFGGTNQEMAEFEIAVQQLAALRKPVDAFFDHVTVNCDDKELREDRLRLLNQISAMMNSIADFSYIEGGDK